MTDFRGARIMVLQPGEGQALPSAGVAGDTIVFKATGDDTGGLLTFIEYHAAPHSIGTPLHVHDSHEEGFYIVAGTLDMQVGDDIIRASPGTWAFAPRGVPHAFWNASDEPCVFVGTFTPPGFERLFVEHADLQAAGRITGVADLRALARRHGTHDTGPPPGLPRP